MEIENLNTYQQLLSHVYAQGVQKNEESTKTWTQYRDRHKKIIEGLQTIVNDVSVNCVVPLGKRALMKGKLTHTNEILVCIGDGYFVKYSSRQAVELCNRRIKRAEEMLKDLEQERNLLEARQMFPMNVGAFESDECQDIIEHCDEKEIEDWRTEHRKKEKEYRQKLIELRKTVKKEIVTEEDLFKRLDELELEEELSDEINRLEGECQDGSDKDQSSDESDEESSEDTTETEEERQGKEIEKLSKQSNSQSTIESAVENNSATESKEKSSESLPKTSDKSPEISSKTSVITTVSQAPKIASPVIIDNKINGKFEVSIIREDEVERTLRSPISRSPSKSVSFDGCTNKKSEESPTSEKAKSSNRRVSFAEPHFTEWQPPDEHHLESEQATKSNIANDEGEEGEEGEEEEEEEEEDDLIRIEFKHSERIPSAEKGKDGEILSPDDVYHMFSTPKSILKKNFEPYQHVRRVPLIDETSDEEYHIEMDEAVKSTYQLVVQDIKERKLGKRATEDTKEATSNKRPVSRFKLERASLQNDKKS